MTPTDLLILCAATWYWSYVLTSSDGPFQIFLHMREWRKGAWHGRKRAQVEVGAYSIAERTPLKDGLLDCIICTAIWVGIVFTLAPHGWLTDASAVAGIGLWLHSYTGWRGNY